MLSQEQVAEIRRDFPILTCKDNLTYLDNAATSQKPLPVLEAGRNYYLTGNANPHRGAHYLANRATEAYEAARRKLAQFVHARRVSELIFTRGTTEGLNLIAYAYGLDRLEEGDEVLISILEHHANLIPWQRICKQKGAKLVYVYPDKDLQISPEAVEAKLTERTKILALTGCSNVTGTRPDLAKIFNLAKSRGITTICDLAQLAPHAQVDVRALGCDFAVFSGHKMCAEMGIGVLWGRYELLTELEPLLVGGEMIERVSEQEAVYASPAARFEAGTQNVGGAISLAAAVDYLQAIGMEEIDQYTSYLTNYALEGLAGYQDIEVYTVAGDLRGPVISFNVAGVHPHDVATVLDSSGIAIRSGHHCAEPLHHYLGQAATCRASFSFYNTKAEVDKLVETLAGVRKVMGLA